MRGVSFGDGLRRERELRQITLREVSEATKINIRYLEALERNDFSFLPAGAFTKGFIRSFANYIGTDEVEMLNAYMDELAQQEARNPKRNGNALGGSCGALLEMPLRGTPRAQPAPRRGRKLLLALLLLVAVAATAAGLWYKLAGPGRSAAGRSASPSATFSRG